MKYIGLLSSAASGKMGGIVASHNRNGSYLRRHVIPVQPRTPAQRAVRDQFSGLSTAFRNLGSSTIAGWNALAKTVTLKSKLGTTYNPTGLQLYVSCGRNLAQIGVAIGNMVAPTIPTIPALPTLTMAQPGNGVQVTTMVITGLTSASSTYGAIVRATSVQSLGRTFIGKSKYRVTQANAVASSLTADQFSSYTTKFGALPYNGTIQFAVKYVDPASGFAGPEVSVNFAFAQPVGVNLFSLTNAAWTTASVAGKATPSTSAVTLTKNGGFAGAINWSITGLPYGVTTTFVPGNPSATLTSVSLALSGLTAGQIGAYNVTITGSYGGFSASATSTLTVSA